MPNKLDNLLRRTGANNNQTNCGSNAFNNKIQTDKMLRELEACSAREINMNALNLPTPHQCQIQNLPQPSSYNGGKGGGSGSDTNSRNAGDISSPEVPIQSELSPMKSSPFKLTP